jgi:hypothetical protein
LALFEKVKFLLTAIPDSSLQIWNEASLGQRKQVVFRAPAPPRLLDGTKAAQNLLIYI